MDTKKLDRWASLLLDTGKRNNQDNSLAVLLLLPSSFLSLYLYDG